MEILVSDYMVNEILKKEIKKKMEELVKKYSPPNKLNNIKMQTEFISVLLPKMIKKYGAKQAGDIMKVIYEELEKKKKEV